MGAVDIALADAQRRSRRRPIPVAALASAVSQGVSQAAPSGRSAPTATPDALLSRRDPGYQFAVEDAADDFRRSVRRRARRGPKLLPPRRSTAVASAITPEQAAYYDYLRQVGTSWSPPEDPVAAELEGYAPTGIRIVRALTGDQPGATTPTVGELLSVGATVGGGAALKATGPALRAVGNATRGRVTQASRAAERAASDYAVGIQVLLNNRRARMAESARGVPSPQKRSGGVLSEKPGGVLNKVDDLVEMERTARRRYPAYNAARRAYDAYRGIRWDLGIESARRIPEVWAAGLLTGLEDEFGDG